MLKSILITLFLVLSMQKLISIEFFHGESEYITQFWDDWSNQFEQSIDCLERYIDSDIGFIRLFRAQKELNKERKELFDTTKKAFYDRQLIPELQKRWQNFDNKWNDWEKNFKDSIEEMKDCEGTDRTLLNLNEHRKKFIKERQELIRKTIANMNKTEEELEEE